MLDADARGEHTAGAVRRVHAASTATSSRTTRSNLDELIDSLARRAAAAQRLMDSLTPEQRAELAGLMAQAHGRRRAGRRDGPAAAGAALGPSGPALGRPAADGRRAGRSGFADATGALAELADLDQLDELLGQDYPGASLDDIDEELIERALGRAGRRRPGRSCAGSSASCASRATCSAAATACS